MAVDELEGIPGVNMADLRLRGFKVHELPSVVNIPVSRWRRDYYKLGLVTGELTMVLWRAGGGVE
jgi:AraC family transcriptional activator of pobA